MESLAPDRPSQAFLSLTHFANPVNGKHNSSSPWFLTSVTPQILSTHQQILSNPVWEYIQNQTLLITSTAKTQVQTTVIFLLDFCHNLLPGLCFCPRHPKDYIQYSGQKNFFDHEIHTFKTLQEFPTKCISNSKELQVSLWSNILLAP